MNDLHAALYGELRVGNAIGYKDVIAIFIGTGIGGALAIDGKLHFGLSSEAGNIGQYLLHAFGIVLSNIVDFFSPQMIVLGGGLTDALPKIVRHEVRAGIHAHSSRSAFRGLRIVTAKYKGHAVTIGAARFAMDWTKQRGRT